MNQNMIKSDYKSIDKRITALQNKNRLSNYVTLADEISYGAIIENRSIFHDWEDGHGD